jgi:ABC-type antimicrobial peptide transport system permease subunit
MRQGAGSEIQSAVERDQASILASLPEIATGAAGERMLSKEAVVLVGLTKRGANRPTNVTIRGLSEIGLALRPQVRITAGRLFRPGSSEIVVGMQINDGFGSTAIGEKLQFGGREWTVVGIFDAGNTAFGTEIWTDVDQLMQTFRRNSYSSIVFRIANPRNFEKVAQRIENDQRLAHRAERETVFYSKQSRTMADFLRVLGVTLRLVFSMGAIIGATITMHAAVASRTMEIATLRALGFRRTNILAAFLGESLVLGFVGGLIGAALASGMQLFTISTMSWQTFSELAFSLVLTPGILIRSLGFGVVMGLIGGFFPAFRAARLNITDALRAA